MTADPDNLDLAVDADFRDDRDHLRGTDIKADYHSTTYWTRHKFKSPTLIINSSDLIRGSPDLVHLLPAPLLQIEQQHR